MSHIYVNQPQAILRALSISAHIYGIPVLRLSDFFLFCDLVLVLEIFVHLIMSSGHVTMKGEGGRGLQTG